MEEEHNCHSFDETLDQLKKIWAQKLDEENPLPIRKSDQPKFIEDSFFYAPYFLVMEKIFYFQKIFLENFEK